MIPDHVIPDPRSYKKKKFLRKYELNLFSFVSILFHFFFHLHFHFHFHGTNPRNQDELERWAVASKQKEDDSIVLQKYTRADEAKIKELNFSIEQLTREKLKCEVKGTFLTPTYT